MNRDEDLSYDAPENVRRDHGFFETGPSITDFRDLRVWREGMALSKAIYGATAKFPREELYGLTSQMRRASVSIPTNIAEGYGRETRGSYIQFLRIAQGSVKELETLLELSFEFGFLEQEVGRELQVLTIRTSKMLRALIRALEKKAT